MKYFQNLETILGKIEIVEENEKIIEVNVDQQRSQTGKLNQETPLLKEAKKQLEEFLKGKRKKFNLPLEAKGTPFREKVWKELEKIPYGEKRCYQEIAKAIGNPKGARAIGMANHNNPIPIFIPCHRVIGKNGKLVGYGLGIDRKEILLKIEEENK